MEDPTSVIDTLAVTQNNKNANSSTEGRLRLRLIESLHEQITAATAMIKGEPYRRYRDRMITNPDTGEKELKSMPVIFRPWFWKDQTGNFFVGLRYSNRWLELKPGMSAVEVGDIENLPAVLKKLLEAVNGGELDGVLKTAAEERCAQFAGRKKAKPASAKI